MAAILAEPDGARIRGVSIDRISPWPLTESRAFRRETCTRCWRRSRLQVGSEERGLVLAYNEANREVSIVDRQLLLYRKYSTVRWPWEDLIAEHDKDANFQADDAALQLDA
jgi:hypothetical protein